VEDDPFQKIGIAREMNKYRKEQRNLPSMDEDRATTCIMKGSHINKV
jgi:hypothetical protein